APEDLRLDAESVRLATSAARGLRRLESLLEDPDLTGPERATLAFEATVALEDLRRVGGCQVLAIRPQLRLVALPGRLGQGLARLDFERLRRLASGGEKRFPPARRSWFNWDSILFVAAARAALLPHAPANAGLHRELFDLGVRWERESVHDLVANKHLPELTRPQAFAELLAGTRSELIEKPIYFALVHEGGLTEHGEIAQAFRTWPEDAA